MATANKKQGARLWDVRVPSRKVPQHGSAQPGNSTAMSVAWNQAGDRLLLGFHRPPVLYSLGSTAAVRQFDHPGYYNSCLLLCWTWSADLMTFASTAGQCRARAGAGPAGGEPDQPVRQAGDSHEEYIGQVLRSGRVVNQEAGGETTEENPRMMAFFDSLVQREIEGWDSSSEDESGGDGGLRSDLSSGSDSDSSSSSEPDSSSRLAGALSSPGREEVFSGGSPAPVASHSQVRCYAVLCCAAIN